ncbi:hypothetical protein HID58_049195 [Brassica napus]|uniref:Uncharacterized protein n=1 Tax=Brassica napus TaxID=3708 RepID=A0ABQ8B4B0_BRANA|nr:hypothetical protein HID58_049195 [Brassica napus]
MGEVTNHIGSSINYNGEEREQGDAESNTLNQPLVKANRKLSSTPLALVGTKVSHIESLDYEYSCGGNRYVTGLMMFAGANLGLTLIASVLCVCFAPTAAGPGIPEIKAYLNGIDTPNMFGATTMFVKIIGSIGAVAAGLDLGKEGPLVHIGTCIASLLGQGGTDNHRIKWRWLRYFNNDRDRRDLITCGSAAGVCAAFRSPVGGVLFALEEVATWWRSALLWRTFFSTAVVVVVLRGFIEICKSGKCGLFGSGGLIMFDVSHVTYTYHVTDIIPVTLIGVIGGVLGSLYNHFLHKVLRLYNLINAEDAVVGRNGAVKTFRLLGFFSGRRRLPQLCRCRLLSPGGGGFHSSVVAGSRLREIWFRRVRSRSETKLSERKTVIQEHNGFGGGSTFCELQSSEAAVPGVIAGLLKGKIHKVLLSLSVSLFTSVCLYGLPFLATCKPCDPSIKERCPTNGRSGNFKQFHCPKGYYSDLATLLLTTNVEL